MRSVTGNKHRSPHKPTLVKANAMDFLATANANGPSDAANRTLRGADPLLSLPPGHVLRRAGFALQPTPGAINVTLDNARASEVEGALIQALRPDVALRTLGFVLRPPVPAKLEAVLLQLGNEPPGRRLDLAATYYSLADFASAVAVAVGALDLNILSPVYTITPADVYDAEPSAVIPASLAALFMPGEELLTWGHLCDDTGFCTHGSQVAWACFGRALTASRDVPTAPTRNFFADVVEFARNKGKLAAGAAPTFVPATVLADWLRSTAARDPPLVFLYESSSGGVTRRQQCFLDRDQLASGTAEQRADVVATLASLEPLRSRLTHIWHIIGTAASPADFGGYLGQLASSVYGTATTVTNVQQLLALDVKCLGHVHALTASAVPLEGAGARVGAIVAAAVRPSALSSPASSGKRTIDAVLASTFSASLASEIGKAPWRALEIALQAELTQLRPNSLMMVKALMNSPILAARRFAKGATDAGVLELIVHSPVLARVRLHIMDWGMMISRMLVVDRRTLLVPVGTTDLKLPDFVTACIKRGAFNEFDMVEGLLRPKLAAEQGVPQKDMYAKGSDKISSEHAKEYPEGLMDADVVQMFEGIAESMSEILGIPTTPPVFAPPPRPMAGQLVPPPPPQIPWVCFPDVFSTINKTRLDINNGDQNFAVQRRIDLSNFVQAALDDGAKQYQRVMNDANPVGQVPGSFLDTGGQAVSDLAKLQQSIVDDRQRKTNNPEQAQMLGWFQSHRKRLMQADREDSFRAVTPERLRDRSRSPLPKREPSLPRERSRSPGRAGTPPPGGRGPGSMHTALVKHSQDRQSFWFIRSGTDTRVSPAYDYATLERLSGFSRNEKCFPVLLSIKSGSLKLEVCGKHDDPAHASMSSWAHVVPDGFLERVRSYFREPTPA